MDDRRVLVLLPPSEGKAEGGTARWTPAGGRFGRALAEQRRQVVAGLAHALEPTGGGGDDDQRLAKLLGVNPGPLLERATATTRQLTTGRAKALPAWQRYTGVVWQHLDPATLDDEQRARILVPSALLGLVTANDPVPDHRLKFDKRLVLADDAMSTTRLDRFWRPHLTAQLRKAAAPARATVLIDLLPDEHRAAFDPTGRPLATAIRVPGTGGHDGKAAKGLLARRLLTEGLDAL